MAGRTLILSRPQVMQLLPMADCVRTQEEVFAMHGRGQAWNGPSVYTNYPNPRPTRYPYLGRLMGGGIEPDWRGTKQIQAARPNRIHVVCLYRADNVVPAAIMEARYLGLCRTGGGAAVAARYLANGDARAVGVLGTGETARYSLLALHALGWPVGRVHVWSRSAENRAEFARILGRLTEYDIVPADGPEPVVRQAEILIVGTAAHEPVFPASWVRPGTLVLAVGQREELDPALFQRGLNVADEIETALAEGHVNDAVERGLVTPEVMQLNLGEVVAGLKPGRTRADEIIVFDSSGLVVQDLAAAIHVYQRAEAAGIGERVEFAQEHPLW